MKQIIGIIVLTLLSASNLPADGLTLKAVEYFDTVYAEWGVCEDGTEFEDRYNGMKFEVYRDGELVGTLVVYQHWFKGDPKRYPAIGETISVPEFDFRVHRLPIGEYSLDYDELPGTQEIPDR